MKKSSLFWAILLCAGASSCIKGKEVEPVVLTPAQQISGNWQLTAYEADSNAGGPDTVRSNAFAQLLPCRQDDVFLFGTDGILLLAEGTNRCDGASGPSTALGRWLLLPDNKQLLFDDPDLPAALDTMLLREISDSTMRLEAMQIFTPSAGGPPAYVKLQKTYRRRK